MAAKKIYKKLQNQIEVLFNHIEHFLADEKSQLVSFDVDSNSIDFDRLMKLSKLLGTKKINFTGKTEEYQIGELTWDSEASAEINAYNVPKEKFL